MPVREVTIGKLITDKSGLTYTIQNVLGRGAFGTVYLAVNQLQQACAIKMIGPVNDPITLKSFEREVDAAEKINHQNVLHFNGQGEYHDGIDSYFFTVTEFCPNGNYRPKIGNERTLDNILPELEQILWGLEALHKTAVHRDLKPENILIAGSTLRIGDLGLSKSIDEATQTLTFKGSGTPNYMAPEVWARGKITPATDLYAFGIILFELLTGRPPFSSDDIEELKRQHLFSQAPRVKSLVSSIPDHVDGLLRKLLEKDANKRYQTADEVLKILTSQPAPATNATISTIRDRIRQSHDAEAGKQLEAQKKFNEAQEAAQKIKYSEQQLISEFEEVIDEINEGLQETKIQKQINEMSASFKFGRRSLKVEFFGPNALYHTDTLPALLDELRKHSLVHSGVAFIEEIGENCQGWNLILLHPPESIYGEWHIVESDISGLTGKALKFSPAATDADLLSENLAYHWMRTTHTWQLKEKMLERKDIERVITMFIS